MSTTKLSDRMRNLAMRAKKMTARMPEVPNATEIQARFEANGEKIQISEAEKLVELVVEHRATKGIGGRKQGQSQGQGQKPSKPKVSTPPQKTSRSYGV